MGRRPTASRTCEPTTSRSPDSQSTTDSDICAELREADAFGAETNTDVPPPRVCPCTAAETSSSSRWIKARPFLNDGHLAAETPVHLREFERNVAAADDDEVTRQDVEIQHRGVGQVVDLVEASHVGHEGAASHIEEDAIGRQQFFSDPDLVRRLKARMGFVDGAIGHAFQPSLQAGARFSRDGILSGLHPFHVDTDSPADRHAIVPRRAVPCERHRRWR